MKCASKSSRRKKASPLEAAVSSGNYDQANALIDAGAKVAKDSKLLIRAIKSNCSEETKCKLVDLLTSNGADASSKWMNINTSPLEESILVSRSVIVAKKLIDSGAKLSEEPELLIKTIEMRCHPETKIKLVEFLIANGCDINFQRTKFPCTPLDAATTTSDCVGVIKLLLERGASAIDPEKGFQYRLWDACARRDLEMIKTLIEMPRTVAGLDGYVNSIALGWAVYGPRNLKAKTRVFKLLVENGIDVNQTCEADERPLHEACGYIAGAGGEMRFPDPDFVRLLLESGADANARMADGRTALQLLCASDAAEYYVGDIDFVNELLECVQILLEHGAEVDVCDDEGNVPFVSAVETGKEEVVDLLLGHMEEALG